MVKIWCVQKSSSQEQQYQNDNYEESFITIQIQNNPNPNSTNTVAPGAVHRFARWIWSPCSNVSDENHEPTVDESF